MEGKYQIQSPLAHPIVNLFYITIITIIVFFGSKFLGIFVIPVLIYFAVKYRISVLVFLKISISIFFVFLMINYIFSNDFEISFRLTLFQTLRWCILLFIGFYFDKFITSYSVIYLFYKLKLFYLSIPFIVATRLIPKLKYDIGMGAKAIRVRGLNSSSIGQTYTRVISVIFMLLSMTITFLLEFGTLLKIRGIDLPQKKITNRFRRSWMDYVLICILVLVFLFDRLGYFENV